ncbi:chalcone isomerase family protein [Aquabacterium sp.]|uniref:chalcone isomerase family protein n=1 Tax=Aquabacterium sp. TaxID=1872578 RepID=UPI0035B22021
MGLLCLAVLASVGGVHAASLEGQRFEDSIVLGNRTLRLNGLGLRGVAWIKAFVAGLYVPTTSHDPAQLLSMTGPKRLRLKVMLEAPSAELSKSMRNGVRHNETPEVQTQLAARVDTFAAAIDGIGKFKPGDVLDLDFVPGRGTQLRLNEKDLGKPIAGEEFYRAIMKIFIGKRPADKRMKEGLLSGAPG